jgi:hypothetical protein
MVFPQLGDRISIAGVDSGEQFHGLTMKAFLPLMSFCKVWSDDILFLKNQATKTGCPFHDGAIAMIESRA